MTSEASELVLSQASLEQWQQVVDWAAAEQWNPGVNDIEGFHPTDPQGFFLGRFEGRTVSAISVVNYSPRYAFLGYYLVHPAFRGRGLGLATWRAAFSHAEDRVVGLDAVPAQTETYKRSGFHARYENLRFAGRPGTDPAATRHLDVRQVSQDPDLLTAVAAYDARCFPAPRPAFVRRWLTGPGHHAYVHLRDGAVAGYAVMRPAHEGRRVGPLFADSREGAEALLDSLAAHLAPDEELWIDVPEPRTEAMSLVTERGLEQRSVTTRMYTDPAQPTRLEGTFGVTSLELG
ncbi:GNAT family N-acetyltransferase [Streptomyces sp. NA04227]|uniref:GNAT family N-acetyltransferase n=1 Tax=Streptomyces sp. NA04227 TaxID=2742136 RepID=UPI0015902B44|nr:GNAT family N-acetyltransferase [Streptomyces sp. NA04227]QKW09088.1 GNAT family N-acetyltransferase [Streptomyces sp. NA04227]